MGAAICMLNLGIQSTKNFPLTVETGESYHANRRVHSVPWIAKPRSREPLKRASLSTTTGSLTAPLPWTKVDPSLEGLPGISTRYLVTLGLPKKWYFLGQLPTRTGPKDIRGISGDPPAPTRSVESTEHRQRYVAVDLVPCSLARVYFVDILKP